MRLGDFRREMNLCSLGLAVLAHSGESLFSFEFLLSSQLPTFLSRSASCYGPSFADHRSSCTIDFAA